MWTGWDRHRWEGREPESAPCCSPYAAGFQRQAPGPRWGGCRRAERAQPPSSMGVIFDVPMYPVIDPAPGMWRTMQNYGLKEYAIIAGIPLGIAPFGYNWGAARCVGWGTNRLSAQLRSTAHRLALIEGRA